MEVWIETRQFALLLLDGAVTSHVEVWIETKAYRI